MKETPTQSPMDVMEVMADVRRALRRAVCLPCDVVSHYWDEPLSHIATNLSPFGMWIDTLLPLHRGAEVVLTFRPPRMRDHELTVFAEVTRVVTGRRRGDRGSIGMGLEFQDLTAHDQQLMRKCLHGLPPPIRRRAAN